MSAFAGHPISSELEVCGSEHLEEILQSECFKRAITLRTLLLYLWNNREKNISEYAIAVEALGRNRDFESKIDASVRVQISRLRQFLAKYYESEGRDATARLIIPLGTHQVQVVEGAPESESPHRPDAPDQSLHKDGMGSVLPPPPAAVAGPSRYLVTVLSAVIVALVVCIGWILWSGRQANKSQVAAKPELPLFWRQFMDNGKSTRIVLPTPVFFTWGPPYNKEMLMVRDVTVNDFNKAEDSPAMADLEKRLGKPRPWRNYTVASDTFASVRLARFFDSYGVQTAISSLAESPQGIIDHENVIVFGTPTSLQTDYRPELDRLTYVLGPYPYENYIVDKQLPAGSAGLFPAILESSSRAIEPGIIALFPRGSTGSRILIVQGSQTTALISYLTSEDGLREITRARAEHGNSPYFEAVILSEVNGENPIQSRLVAFRPYPDAEAPANKVNEAALSSASSAAIQKIAGNAGSR